MARSREGNLHLAVRRSLAVWESVLRAGPQACDCQIQRWFFKYLLLVYLAVPCYNNYTSLRPGRDFHVNHTAAGDCLGDPRLTWALRSCSHPR